MLNYKYKTDWYLNQSLRIPSCKQLQQRNQNEIATFKKMRVAFSGVK